MLPLISYHFKVVLFIFEIINNNQQTMKNLFFILILLLLTIFNCSDGSESVPQEPEEVIEDIIKPPYAVKYEVVFSSNSISNDCTTAIHYSHEYPKGNWLIASAPGTRDVVSNSELTQSWTKEFTVTVDNNPLTLQCWVTYKPKVDATATIRIYVNDKLVTEKIWSYNPASNLNCAGYDFSYKVY